MKQVTSQLEHATNKVMLIHLQKHESILQKKWQQVQHTRSTSKVNEKSFETDPPLDPL